MYGNCETRWNGWSSLRQTESFRKKTCPFPFPTNTDPSPLRTGKTFSPCSRSWKSTRNGSSCRRLAAAKRLGISRATLYNKLNKLRISLP
nr:helix-turn-helix domain-containing protein [Brevibacillus panacihumi]